MRTIKKFIATALTMAMCVTMIGTANVSAATKVKLNKTKVTVTVGRSVKLKVKGTKVKVKWLTSNKKVAVVKKGKVTGKKAGKAVITAKVGKKAYKCKVTVKKAVKEQETTKPVETVKPAAPATVNPVVKPTTPTETTKPEETTTPEVEEKDNGIFYYIANNKTKTCKVKAYEYSNYDTTEGSEVIIPESIDGYTVTGIETNAIRGENIKRITIPSTIKEINPYAFYDTYIEKDNFINNSNLDAETNNYWGAAVYDKADGSMYYRDNKLIRFRQNLPTGEIDEWGDLVTTKTTEITITSDIKGYVNNLFTYGRTNLNYDDTSKSWTYTYDTEKTELEKVTISEDVTELPENVFNGIVLPDKSSLVNNSSLDAEANDYWGIRFVNE